MIITDVLFKYTPALPTWRRPVFFTVIGLTLLLLHPFNVNAAGITYANNSFGIWSPLTQFERTTLQQLNKAKAGDPDILLALYIIASGDARTEKDFLRYQNKIKQVLQKIKPSLDKTVHPREKGALLHTAMHRYFFAYSEHDPSLNSYDLNQSQLTTLLDKKTYNCISSTLLYSVLARYSGLNVQGVTLSSHSFAQLKLGNEIIEVETTSKNGFGLKHDKAFYKAQSKNWFLRRGLAASTFQDYQNRKIVAPYRLAAINMSNQHAQKNRIADNDRIRLAEIAAFIHPKHKLSQLNRLYSLAEEFDRITQQQNWPFLEKLYVQTYPKIIAAEPIWQNDAELNNALAHYYSQALCSYAQNGNLRAAKKILSTHHEKFKQNLKDIKTIQNNLATSIGVLLSKAIQQQDYEQGKSIIESSKNLLHKTTIWNKNISWYYNERVKPYWQDENWPSIINIYEEYYKLSGRIDKSIKNNLLTAYHNWSIAFYNNDDSAGMIKVWQDCIIRFGQLSACKKEYRKLSR